MYSSVIAAASQKVSVAARLVNNETAATKKNAFRNPKRCTYAYRNASALFGLEQHHSPLLFLLVYFVLLLHVPSRNKGDFGKQTIATLLAGVTAAANFESASAAKLQVSSTASVSREERERKS